jgi:translation initiation factor 2B subunit (eIF-2B alpha/beta/delta family)
MQNPEGFMKDLNGRVARIANDRESGAAEVQAAALSVLADALADGADLKAVAQALLRAQPSMAPVWNAVRAAVAAQTVETFDRYVQQVTRAPRALVRHATGLLLPDVPSAGVKLVTISFSSTVLLALEAVAQQCPLEIATAEGQPALEGRRAATRLAAAGIAVAHYTDAALGLAVGGADAIVVGADAVSPEWFLNKSGTRMLAATAAQQGIPVYVLATRDKFLSSAVAARLRVRDEAPAEVWPAPPAGVTVRNPYFEPTPLDLVSAVVSEAGVLGAALVPDACPTGGDELLLAL